MKNKLTEILSPSKVLKPLPTGIKSSGKKLGGIRACIFDIYGTLLISGSGDVGTAMIAGSAESFARALQICGIESFSGETILSIKEMFFARIEKSHSIMKKNGFPYPEIDIIDIWSGIITSDRIKDAIPALADHDPMVIAAAYESAVNPVYPMPGMKLLLEELAERGLKIGIVSNAQFYTPLIMDILFPGGFTGLGIDTELCLFSYIEKRAKPDTKLFKELSVRLGQYGIKPEETVYIGNDMLKDIMPSSVCGYKTALFAGDKRSLRLREQDDACSNVKPDVIVEKLTDLLNYIQEG